MKRSTILIGAALVVVIAIGVTGAFAQFTDTETSADNTFEAGTLDLKVDDQDDPEVVSLSFEDIAPGFSEYHTWELKNVGSVPGQPTIELGVVDSYDNGCTEPEGDLDTTCGDPGPGEGELQNKLYIRLEWSNDAGSTWHQLRCNGNWGDHLLYTCEGVTVGLGDFAAVGPGIDTALPVLGEGESVTFRFHPWWHNTATDNIAQSDGVVFDFIFHLDQAP
jgi:spore coat-associated protein N